MVASTLPTCQPAPRTRRAASASSAQRIGALELRVGVGEVVADVAERGGAEQRIGDRMAERIGIGVAGQAVRVRDLDAAEDQLAAGDQRMRVPAFADAQSGPRGFMRGAVVGARSRRLGEREVGRAA